MEPLQHYGIIAAARSKAKTGPAQKDGGRQSKSAQSSPVHYYIFTRLMDFVKGPKVTAVQAKSIYQ